MAGISMNVLYYPECAYILIKIVHYLMNIYTGNKRYIHAQKVLKMYHLQAFISLERFKIDMIYVN